MIDTVSEWRQIIHCSTVAQTHRWVSPYLLPSKYCQEQAELPFHNPDVSAAISFCSTTWLLLLFAVICSIITRTLRLNLFCFHFVVLSSFAFVRSFIRFLFRLFFCSSRSHSLLSDRIARNIGEAYTHNNRREIGKFFKCRNVCSMLKRPCVFFPVHVCIVIRCTHAQ